MNNKNQEKDIIFTGFLILSVLAISITAISAITVAAIFFPNTAMYSVFVCSGIFVLYATFFHKKDNEHI